MASRRFYRNLLYAAFGASLFVHGWVQADEAVVQVRTPSLHLYYPAALFPGGEEGAAERSRISRSLEMLAQRINAVLGERPGSPVSVHLMSKSEFRNKTGAPSWATAIFFRKEIFIPANGIEVFEHDEFKRTLRHEYVHALVSRMSRGRCPAWFDEGLAQAFEGPRSSQLQRMLDELAETRPRPLSDLHSGLMRLSRKDASAAYAQSYLAVKLLLNRGGPAAVGTFLRSLSSHVSADAALRQAFRKSRADLEREIAAALGRG